MIKNNFVMGFGSLTRNNCLMELSQYRARLGTYKYSMQARLDAIIQRDSKNYKTNTYTGQTKK